MRVLGEQPVWSVWGYSAVGGNGGCGADCVQEARQVSGVQVGVVKQLHDRPQAAHETRSRSYANRFLL